MLYGLVGCIKIWYGILGCIEILYGIVGRIENLYGLVRKELFLILQAFQYTTNQSRLKIKDKNHTRPYRNAKWPAGCMEILLNLVAHIENLYVLVREKLFQIF